MMVRIPRWRWIGARASVVDRSDRADSFVRILRGGMEGPAREVRVAVPEELHDRGGAGQGTRTRAQAQRGARKIGREAQRGGEREGAALQERGADAGRTRRIP